MQTLKPLQDILKKNLKILFVGTSPGVRSSKIGHYFAGKSNVFWKLLYESGLTPVRLFTEKDQKLIEYNFGLTDVVKTPTRSTTDIKYGHTLNSTNRLNKLLEKFEPKIVAFVGKRGFQIYNQRLNEKYKYGYQGKLNNIRIYLIPSSSGQSYRDTKYNEKLHWYKLLKLYSDRV